MMDLVVILGPTAVGKTSLSLKVAKAIDGEIINGDAMQFYRGLDIGTAKISSAEMEGVPHHLLSFLEPDENFSVALYQRLVREKIAEIKGRFKVPILVGGSGLYLSSIIDDYQFLGTERQAEKTRNFQDKSLEELVEILKNDKPKLYQVTDLKNRRRVLRALDKSDSDIQERLDKYYQDSLIIGLNMSRDILYQRIDERVDKMIEVGLVEEVKKLFEQQINSQATKAIGYKELFRYFNQEISFTDAVALIKRNSRRYAKRQLTWFNNKLDVKWFDKNLISEAEIVKIIKKEVNSKK